MFVLVPVFGICVFSSRSSELSAVCSLGTNKQLSRIVANMPHCLRVFTRSSCSLPIKSS